MQSMNKITSADNYDELISRGKHVIMATTQWCRVCSSIKPDVERLAQKYPEVTFSTVDMTAVPDFADAKDITTVPAFLIYDNSIPRSIILGGDVPAVESKLLAYKMV